MDIHYEGDAIGLNKRQYKVKRLYGVEGRHALVKVLLFWLK